MKELLIEWEGLNKQGGSFWIGRGGGSLSTDVARGNEVSETIDRYIDYTILDWTLATIADRRYYL